MIGNVKKLSEDENSEEYNKTSHPEENKRVVINVGGFKHEVLWQTLNRFPETKLGRLKKNLNTEYLNNLCDDFDAEKLEFFYDRDPTLFNSILNYYREGKLHIIDNMCPNLLQSELDYWEIDEPEMDLYCEEKFYHKQQVIIELVDSYLKIVKEEKHKIEEINKINSNKIKVWKNKIWNTLENPFEKNSSLIAKVFYFIQFSS